MEVNATMARIAVEDGLQDIKDALQNSGHEVVSLDATNLINCQCCVISGIDKDVTGIADRATEASVINANGLTTAEVVDQVNQRVNML